MFVVTGHDMAVSLSGVLAGFLPLIAGAVVVLGIVRKIGR